MNSKLLVLTETERCNGFVERNKLEWETYSAHTHTRSSRFSVYPGLMANMLFLRVTFRSYDVISSLLKVYR